MAVTARSAVSVPRFAAGFDQNPIGWVLGIFFVRYLADALRDAARGTEASLGHLANLGIFQILAWAVAFHLVAKADAHRPSAATFITAGLISLTALLPDDNGSWIGISALAAYAFFAFPKDRYLRAAAIVMLALATQLFWGRILFELVAFQIEVMDARLAADLLSLLHRSVTLTDNLIVTPRPA